MSDAYDKELRILAMKVAQDKEFDGIVHEGVYTMLVGPSYETVTELRFLRMIGTDAVGKI